jgi:hypothetical protein
MGREIRGEYMYMHALSAGVYTTTLYVMVDIQYTYIVEGGKRASPTLTRLG